MVGLDQAKVLNISRARTCDGDVGAVLSEDGAAVCGGGVAGESCAAVLPQAVLPGGQFESLAQPRSPDITTTCVCAENCGLSGGKTPTC